MKFLKTIRAWWRGLFRKRRFNMLNATDNTEEWHMHLSPASILAGLVAFMLMLFILTLSLVAYSPILEFLPGYRTEADRSRESLVQNIIRLDSMERMMNDMLTYNENIALIMEGRTPVARVLASSDSSRISKVLVMPSHEDSLLRAQMEGDGEYAIAGQGGSRRKVREAIELATPVEGIITGKFDIRQGNFGVKIAATAADRISHRQRHGGSEPLDPGDGLHRGPATRREPDLGLQEPLAVARNDRPDHPFGRTDRLQRRSAGRRGPALRIRTLEQRQTRGPRGVHRLLTNA